MLRRGGHCRSDWSAREQFVEHGRQGREEDEEVEERTGGSLALLLLCRSGSGRASGRSGGASLAGHVEVGSE